MKKVEMIVTDLDGTLLNINEEVEKTTIEYLKKLKQEGYIIVIATGRILKSAINITQGAEFAKYIISDNGSRIYDMINKKDLFKLSIQKDTVEKICSYYDDKINIIEICNDEGYFAYFNDNGKNPYNLTQINNIKEFLKKSSDITHLSIIPKNNEYIETLKKKIEKGIPNVDLFVMRDSFGEQKWMDLHAGNMTKYDSIKKIAKLEKIENKKIIAFGDGLNDITMLKNCGVGVAMGNSLEEVKEISNYVTTSHNEEGIKYFLEKYLK